MPCYDFLAAGEEVNPVRGTNGSFSMRRSFLCFADLEKNVANDWVGVCGRLVLVPGITENLGWVKDEKNARIREKFKKVFEWFDQDGDEDNPNSIVLKITLTEGVIIDFEKKYGELKYEVDFFHKTAE